MVGMSPEGWQLLAELINSPDAPRVLANAVTASRVAGEDLPDLIERAWLYTDEPTKTVPEQEWLPIFSRAGFFSRPSAREQPVSSMTVYRGATCDRAMRMSWAETPEVARALGARHALHEQAYLYEAVVRPSGSPS